VIQVSQICTINCHRNMSVVSLKRNFGNDIHNLCKGCEKVPVKKTKLSLRDAKEDVTFLYENIKNLINHIFCTPFRKRYATAEDSDYFCMEHVLQKIKRNEYVCAKNVFKDLFDVLNNNQRKADGFDNGEIHYTKEDVLVMASEMRKKINVMRENIFSENTKAEDSILEDICFKPSDVKNHAVAKSDSPKEYPKYKTYTFHPSRKHDFNTENIVHSYIAGYQFHKMITKSTKAPVPMRKILNVNDAIESITYIENEDSKKEYEKQKELFRQRGNLDKDGKVEELLLFHGTVTANLSSIVTNNFDINAIPQQLNTENEQRKKVMMFGKGVYFSELPAVSLMYGNGLLLCKVLPGKSEAFRPQGSPPSEISDRFDSREVLSPDCEGVIHVIKSSSQILPYCVIQLKKQSLSLEYTKPAKQNLASNIQQSENKVSDSLNSHSKIQDVRDHESSKISSGQVKNCETLAGSPDKWTVLSLANKRNDDDNDATSIKNTLLAYTKSIILCQEDSGKCPVCQEELSSEPALILNSCSHKIHTSCTRQLLLHQTGKHHIQCPLCQKIQGTRVGNQPVDMIMSYKKHQGSLPGHDECGMIVIRYSLSHGIQKNDHPHPGKPFIASGFPRTAFLPDNERGNQVLQLLVKAFRRRLIFTIGRSLTSGQDDCVIWNGIHHKTRVRDNGNGHGFPDAGYLERVVEELKEKGVQ